MKWQLSFQRCEKYFRFTSIVALRLNPPCALQWDENLFISHRNVSELSLSHKVYDSWYEEQIFRGFCWIRFYLAISHKVLKLVKREKRSLIDQKYIISGMTSTRNQYYATFCANLLCLSYGLSTGWTSAAIPLLQAPQTPLFCGPITDEDASLIGSILTVGGLCGTLMFGFAANEIGRKLSIFLIAFPQIVGWIFMYSAENAQLLIIFRFLAGLSAGGIFTVVPVYISEISEDRWVWNSRIRQMGKTSKKF